MYSHQEEAYQRVQQLVTELFPNPDSLQFVIDPATHKATIDWLQNGLQHEQFYMVVNMLPLEITAAGGLDQMGWPAIITYRDYLDLFPGGGTFQMIAMLAREMVTLTKHTNNQFMMPKFVTHIPLKHASGKLLLVKRVLSPWQLTTTGLVSAYMNEFVILKDYEGEAMNPRFVGLPPDVEEAFYQKIRQLYANLPARKNPFAPKELELLRIYASDDQRKQTAKTIAEKLQVTELTVKDYNKEVLRKAREVFAQGVTFRNARDVAEHMLRNKFIINES